MTKLGAVLIANRGEIACRIIRSCHDLGIKSIAVYSDADADSLHVRSADHAVRIGPPQVSASYLNKSAIIAAAKESGAQAVHPGYGFLAENAEFADLCAESGLIFIGPSADTIRCMGDKAAARAAAVTADVPVVPGTETVDVTEVAQAAAEVGYPVMLKAAAGGGGRGIRIVRSADELDKAFSEAQREASAAFGDGRLYLEKVIEHARHVEVQVLGDGRGQVIHLFDRDCSIQRKRQKLIEEAPGPTLGVDLRRAITSAAVQLASSVNYKNAGTLEFLVTPDNRFYFIEMNTRIQVEHPITEMITGVDLVAQQFAIAGEQGLRLSQSDIRINGAAIEFRINAEDPEKGFMPSPGLITNLSLPSSIGVRSDFGVVEGGQVAPYYDSMVGKLIVWGPTREEALKRSAAALEQVQIAGIRTTLSLHRRLIAEPWFYACQFDTTTLERFLASGVA